MKAFRLFALICLSGGALGLIQIPTGCSRFYSMLNGFHSINLPLFTKRPIPTLSSLFGKRFILNHPININFSVLFDTSRQLVLDSVKPTLPASKEIAHTCRIGLQTTSQKDIEFVRAMAKHYKVCVMCDEFDTNTTTCETLGFCPSYTVCYRGHSDDRKYWPKSSTYTIFDAIHPEAVFHGCCVPTDHQCRNKRYNVKNKNNNDLNAANYTLHICSSIGCNGDDRTTVNSLVSKINKVDGHWASWGRWGHCSVTCGTGTRSRRRTCTNPAPSSGGKSCIGSSVSTSHCSASTVCPVNGHWSGWQAWGKCSMTCGGGQQTRARSCTNPHPTHGGKACVGTSSESRKCGHSCIINGGWSNWHEWSKCSKSCTAGIRSRVRTCSQPAPAHGGKQCVGDKSATEHCDNGPCPEWSRWFYDACSVSCGNGTTMRLRHCSSGKDSDCGTGNVIETVNCSERPCPMDGSWGAWNKWSKCTATCGDGQHARHRFCNDPSPQNGGADCKGTSEETTMCNIQDCTHWFPFEVMSSCSVTCGKGFMQMKRNCSTGIQSDCNGSAFNERICILDECM